MRSKIISRSIVTLPILYLLLCIGLFASPPVFADENDTVTELFKQKQEEIPAGNEVGNTDQNASQEENTSTNLLYLFFKTILILFILIIVFYAIVKFISARNMNRNKNRYLQVKSGVSLGPNKSLKLVKMGNSYLLLGVGDNVQLIREITSEEEIQEIEYLQQQTMEEMLSTAKKMTFNLKDIFSRKKESDNPSFYNQLEERLTRLQEKEEKDHDKKGEIHL